MCGRFAQTSSIETLQAHFYIDHVTCELNHSQNIYPSQKVSSLIMHNSETRLGLLHWGLVPFWEKEKPRNGGFINARVENVSDKPSFAEPFKKRRCLIIADGYYEWKQDYKRGNKKIPYFFKLPSKEPFAFAGLWESWQDDYYSCTIITREACDAIKDIHHRMPLILHQKVHNKWIDPENQNIKELNLLLKNNSIDEFVCSEFEF